MKDSIIYSNLKDFRCSPNCIDTCCLSTWNINIDETTMELYNSMEDEMGQRIRDSIEKRGDKYYFNTSDSQYCKMYDKEHGLCNIHKTLGEDYLCNTCKTYPRALDSYNNILHYGYYNSCPEVVKLYLLNENPLAFTYVTVDFDDITPDMKSNFSSYISESSGFAIRGICRDILQDRSIPLLERIFYVGGFMEKLDASYKRLQNESAFDRVIEFYRNKRYYFDDINNILYSKLVKEGLTKNLYNALFAILKDLVVCEEPRKENKDFYITLNSFFNDFENFINTDIVELRERLFAPYLAEHEYVFENYLVNLIFINKFPMDNKTLKEAFLSLVFDYLMIQLFTVGIFNKKESLTDEDIINAIYYFNRKSDHSVPFKNSKSSILQQLCNLNLSTVTYINLISI